MEFEKSDLTNSLSAEKARAEDLSGLSPVLEEFYNGVDIQPVENIAAEEFIPFEDNTETEKEEIEYIPEAKKAKINKSKKILRGVVALVLMCVVAFAGYWIFTKYNDYAHSAAAVYQRGDAAEILLDNKKTIEIEDVVEAKISTDGNYLVYSQNSHTKTGKLDIRVIDLKKRSSVKNKGTIAVIGAEKGWQTSADCSYVYYTVTEDGKLHYYAYITEKKESAPIVFDASSVFIPPNGDIIYFTRDSGELSQLFRMRIGEKATAIEKVSEVKAFSDNETQELIYMVENDDSTYKLCKVSGDSEPVVIAKNISEVYLDDYSVGGNLYYFIKNESKLNWNDFVTDEYSYSDSKMEEPRKEDYTYTVGFLFKREKFNESEYNQAKQRYDKKLVRDSVRKALNEADLGLAISSEYKMFVYDGEKGTELISGVRLEDILAYSKTGTPRVIAKKTEINTSNKITIDTLYDTAVKNGADLAVNYMLETLRNGGYKTDYGCKYVYYNGNNVHEYSFAPEYGVDSASFLFSSKNSIFAAVKSDDVHYALYCSTADTEAISKEKQIAEGVTSFEAEEGRIYFTVASEKVNNDLYVAYSDGSTALISENTVQHDVKGDCVYVVRTQEDETLIKNVDLLMFKNKKTEEIDRNVLYKSIMLKDHKVAYIKDYEYSSEDKKNSYGGKMIIFEDNKKTEIGNLVSTIYDIK